MIKRHSSIRLFLVLSLLLYFHVSAWASTNDIQNIIMHLQKSVLFKGDFEQKKVLQGISRQLRSSGIFIYWRNHGLYWETTKPFHNALTYTPNEIIQWESPGIPSYDPAQQKYFQQKMSRMLLSIFSADLPSIKERFTTSWKIEKDKWSLNLIPIHTITKDVIKHVKISGDKFVKQIAIFSPSGDHTEINFINISSISFLGHSDCARFSSIKDFVCGFIIPHPNKTLN